MNDKSGSASGGTSSVRVTTRMYPPPPRYETPWVAEYRLWRKDWIEAWAAIGWLAHTEMRLAKLVEQE